MKMQGEQHISASREAVWAALNDPKVLQQCIAGCERLTRTDENAFEGVVTAKVGPVKATFKGAVTLEDLVPPQSYRIVGEGKGGVAGFAKGGATVTLAEAEGGTLMTYDVDAKIGGKLAQLGARLIESTARSYADQFFATFKTVVESPAGQSATTSVADAPAEPLAEPATDEIPPLVETTVDPLPVEQDVAPGQLPPAQHGASDKGLPAWAWIAVLGALLAIFLMFFTG